MRFSGRFPRRQFLRIAAGAAALPAICRAAKAQAYPSRPITLIVPFAAGGPTDVIGRLVAERMSNTLGQALIVENITGAEGSIGAGRAARARPDGYTICFGLPSTHALNGALYSLPYDVVNDFAPVSPLVVYSYFLFARKSLAASNLPELIAWLKADPDRASMGIGASALRFVAALFAKETGTQFAAVPYRGLAVVMQDLIAGQIDLAIGTPDELQLVQTGGIKAYATTGGERSAIAPAVPTFGELGLSGLSYSSWYGLFVPKGTPKAIVARLNASVLDTLAEPAVQSRLADLGFEILPRDRQTPAALSTMQRADIEKWWPIIKGLGIRAE